MELPVEIKHVIFKGTNGFRILSATLDLYSAKYKSEMEDIVKECLNEKYKTFVITVGMMAEDENPVGGQYIFVGDIVLDPKRKTKQFKAEFYYQDAPSTEEGLKTFLMTLPNIKEARANAIIEKFGVDGVIDILDLDIYRLTEINGINEKRIPAIKKYWEEKKALRDLYTFCINYDIGTSFANKIYNKWGNASIKILKETPYKTTEVRGIGFLTADGFAHKIASKDGTKINESERVTACMHYVLEESLNKQSDLYVVYPDFKERIIKTLVECDNNLSKKADPNIYMKLIPDCLKNNLHIFTLVKDLESGEGYIYLSYVWDKEYYISKSLWDRKIFNHASKGCNDNDIGGEEAKLELFSKKPVKLDETQKNAIKTAFDHKISIITGAGGTGKSTICRCICSLAHKKGLKVRLMSPTGKAAQVLSKKTGCAASTIHRSLKMKPGEDDTFENITEDILLVDEISMSGLDTMYALTTAMSDNLWGNIVFVGDKNQLPSVSPGNFLSDIIDSGCANVVTLDKIHRTDEKSYIPLIANEISKGKVVEIPKDAADIKWHSLKPETFHQDLLEFVDKYLTDGNDMEDLQIISPMKKGECGVYKINEVIQDKMSIVNSTVDKVLQVGFHKFHVGDRVIQLENNYDKSVFNGDMGLIKDCGEKVVDPSVSDKKERFITVEFYGDELNYYGEEIEQLQLAWAITVHKFQGSSSKHVIFVMASEQQIMMSKELVYTAFTRAEKQLDIFGNESMLRVAPTRSIVRKRATNVKKIIEEFRTNKNILKVLRKEKE